MELGVDKHPLLFLFLYILVAWRGEGRALNDGYTIRLDDGKIFKKVAKGACNLRKTVYSMSSFRVFNQSQAKESLQ